MSLLFCCRLLRSACCVAAFGLRNSEYATVKSWRNFRSSSIVLCLGLLFLAIACRTDPISCDDRLGCVIVRPNNSIRLATLLPATGETAVWGQEISRGIDLAIVDQGGQLLGHDIELIPLDSACDPDTAQQAIQTVNSDNTLLGIIGPACSDAAQAILSTVYRNDWLMISPASSAPTLTENQNEMAFFRTVPNHLHQAVVAAHFAYEQLGVRQTAVFQDETSYNSLLAQQFSNTFNQLGGMVSYQGTLAVGQIELDDMLTETTVNPPELIYLALFEPEANLLVNRLTETSPLNRAALLGGDSLLSASFATGSGEAVMGMFITGPAFSNEAYTAFLEDWATQHEAQPTTPAPAYAYDATQLLLAAIADTAVVGQTGTLVIGREALRERLAATDGTAGLTGTLRCDTTGECAATGYGVYELDTAVLENTAWPPPLIWQFEE